MYKVFVNDSLIIITSSQQQENDYPVLMLSDIVLEEIIHKLRNNSIAGLVLYTVDLEEGWRYFLTKIKVISAAGGLVLNDNKEVLFIYRADKWDLPKGRIEKGETIEDTALREVEEECGIFNLKLVKPLVTTYHIYFQNGNKLKETHWFLMHSNYTKKLVPQLEEGITKVLFKNKIQVAEALKNTYSNIKLVYDTYQTE